MPLAKNDIITLEITALTNEGSGVGHYKEDNSDGRGMAVFVPLTAVGDVVSCRVVKALKSYAYGRVEKIITASADRVADDCPVYGKCGGCCFRHISYEAELRAKEGFVRDAFARIGGLSPELLPIQGSQSPEEYRNKLQMPVAKQDGKTVCGFFSERSHRVIPVEKCALQPELFSEITQFVMQQADVLRISVYNEEKHEGVLRHIYLRRGHYSGEVCLCLVARRRVPEFAKLARAAAEKFMKNLKLAAIETHVADAKTCCLNPATSTHRQMNDEQLAAAGVPAGLIRISCGLEDKNDLIADIAQALDAI